MLARTPSDAVKAFRESLRLAVSYVTLSVLTDPEPYGPTDRLRQITLPSSPARLRGSGLGLSIRIGYRLVEISGERRPWSVSVVAYQYKLDDRDGREILAYHWHPEGRVTVPHVHVGAGTAEGRLRPDLARAHLPTGHVPLRDVLRLAIAELGVRPLRPDWDAVLRRTHEATSYAARDPS